MSPQGTPRRSECVAVSGARRAGKRPLPDTPSRRVFPDRARAERAPLQARNGVQPPRLGLEVVPTCKAGTNTLLLPKKEEKARDVCDTDVRAVCTRGWRVGKARGHPAVAGEGGGPARCRRDRSMPVGRRTCGQAGLPPSGESGPRRSHAVFMTETPQSRGSGWTLRVALLKTYFCRRLFYQKTTSCSSYWCRQSRLVQNMAIKELHKHGHSSLPISGVCTQIPFLGYHPLKMHTSDAKITFCKTSPSMEVRRMMIWSCFPFLSWLNCSGGLGRLPRHQTFKQKPFVISNPCWGNLPFQPHP